MLNLSNTFLTDSAIKQQSLKSHEQHNKNVYKLIALRRPLTRYTTATNIHVSILVTNRCVLVQPIFTTNVMVLKKHPVGLMCGGCVCLFVCVQNGNF